MNPLPQLRYRAEALVAANPRFYSFALRSLGSPSPLKLLFVEVVKRGDVVFDVGANRGIFTSYFSNLVGPRGTVHAFEPSSKSCDMLRASLQLRTLHDNVVLNCCAVGDTPGFAMLRTPADDDGQASLVEHTDGSWSAKAEVRTEPCKILTLDNYVQARELKKVDFVKVDVEGAERLVVGGFMEGLKRFKPLLALEVCSLWSKDFGYQPSQLLVTLQRLGYDRFDEVGNMGRLTPLRSFDSFDKSNASFDVICSVSSSDHEARLSSSQGKRRQF